MPARRNIVPVLRKIHRWAAAVLALFIGAIALSGTVLQVIIAAYGDTGPRQAPGEPLWAVDLRDLAVTVHTGAFTGITGVYCGVICGLGLLVFTVSGAWMYLEVYRARVTMGRRNPFLWNRMGKAAAMRSLHRCMTLPMALFMLLLSLTGVSLNLYFARYDMVPLPPPRGAKGLGGPPPLDGRVWHDVSLSLHKLNFLGEAGHVLGVAIGLALTMLVVSGGWVYLSMYRQRRKLFW